MAEEKNVVVVVCVCFVGDLNCLKRKVNIKLVVDAVGGAPFKESVTNVDEEQFSEEQVLVVAITV